MASRRITIIGLGLIGGSLGMALKQADPSVVIHGCSRRASTVRKALHLGVIDRGFRSPGASVEGSSVVFICTPVRTIKEIMISIAPYLRRDCIVTDVASTKAEVMRWAEDYLPAHVNFIGGHPMAGKEVAGVEAAEPGLFRNCVWCLSPSSGASRYSLRRLMGMVRSIGARPYRIDPDRHDKLVAGISHLPFILSSTLVSLTSGSPLWAEMSHLASSGYRDVTRLASGDSRIYTDICLTNRQSIVEWIDSFILELQRLRKLVADGDETIEGVFSRVKEARDRWLMARQR